MFLLMQLTGVLQGLVVVAETADAHVRRAVGILDFDVEVAHHKIGEIIASEFEKQLVLVDGVGVIGDDVEEFLVALRRKFAHSHRIAVAEHDGTPTPHVAEVELAAVQPPTLLHAVHNHSGHLREFALRKFLDQHLHIGHTAAAVAVVEFGKSIDEDEFVAILTHREAFLGNARIAANFAVAVGLESIVGRAIERVLDLFAELRRLDEIRVGEQCRPRTFGIFGFESGNVGSGQIVFATPRMKQEKMVIDIGHLLKFGEVGQQAHKLLLAEAEMVEFVLENDTRMVESVLNDEVAGGDLIFRERNLRQIIFALVRIVLRTVRHLFQRVLNGLLSGNRIEHFLRHFAPVHSAHDRLIDALPMIDVFTLSPLSFKGLLALLHRQGIVKIPFSVLLGVGRRLLGIGLVAIAHRSVALHLLLRIGLGLLPFFLFFLLFQGFNHAVDGGISVFLAHFRQRLQRVLQMDGIGVGTEFVKHLRAIRQLLVVLALLVEQSDGLAVASLCVAELLLQPIKIAEFQQQNAFFDTAPRGFLVAFFVGGNSLHRVALRQINIAERIINLVEIILVLVRCRHPFQTTNHRLRLTPGHHLGHRDSGIEFDFVGRILRNHLFISLVSLLLMSKFSLQLSEQIVFASLLLLAHFVFDDLSQIGHRLGIVARVDVVVGHRVVPFFLRTPVNRVATHIPNHVLGIVNPVLFDVALRQPRPRPSVNRRLCLIEPTHIIKG